MILALPKTVTPKDTETIKSIFKESKIEVGTVQRTGKEMIIRSAVLNKQKKNSIFTKIIETFLEKKKNKFETFGQTIEIKTTTNK